MDKLEIISCMKKYRELTDNEREKDCFDEVIKIFQLKEKSNNSSKKKIDNKIAFEEFLKNNTSHPEQYFNGEIKNEILQNKNMMLEYWKELDAQKQESFTMLQLHIILYIISGSKIYWKKRKIEMIQHINKSVNSILEHKGFDNFVL